MFKRGILGLLLALLLAGCSTLSEREQQVVGTWRVIQISGQGTGQGDTYRFNEDKTASSQASGDGTWDTEVTNGFTILTVLGPNQQIVLQGRLELSGSSMLIELYENGDPAQTIGAIVMEKQAQ